MPRTPPPSASRSAVRIPLDDPHERPTVPPPFDLGAFARSKAKRSDRPDQQPDPLATARPIEPMPVVAIEPPPGPVIVERTIDDPHHEMHEAMARADYAAAVEMAELILSLDSGNRDAVACIAAARAIVKGRGNG
jgi:hypothetical protein